MDSHLHMCCLPIPTMKITTSKSSKNFLQPFKRFTPRRKRPTIIYCVNGSNFLGVENLLQEIDWDNISPYSLAQNII